MAVYQITNVVPEQNGGAKNITGKASPGAFVTVWEERMEGVISKWVPIGRISADANGDFRLWTAISDRNAQNFLANDGDTPTV